MIFAVVAKKMKIYNAIVTDIKQQNRIPNNGGERRMAALFACSGAGLHLYRAYVQMYTLATTTVHHRLCQTAPEQTSVVCEYLLRWIACWRYKCGASESQRKWETEEVKENEKEKEKSAKFVVRFVC